MPGRYHYERYQDTNAPVGNTWARRVQWLVFDRNGVGCMCSLGTEREAALIVAALNAFATTEDAQAFTELAWAAQARDARRVQECSDCYGTGVLDGELCAGCKGRRRA